MESCRVGICSRWPSIIMESRWMTGGGGRGEGVGEGVGRDKGSRKTERKGRVKGGESEGRGEIKEVERQRGRGE